ncbi:MAG: PAAR domain-containing protein [Gemmatimonadales bacterium]
MSGLGPIELAIRQHMDGTTGDQSSSLDRAANTPASMGGVASNWWSGMSESVQNLVHPAPAPPDQTAGQAAVATVRRVQAVASSVMGAVGLAKDMLDMGFASLTAPLAAVMPSMPAATITMPYLGMPHAHNHPPSLIPPAPPVPLPSFGMITLGTSVRVLINSMPAARCGDIGLAPTCCGLFPFFQIKTGSSNTFIGGNRAARLGDICEVCGQADDRKMSVAQKALHRAGQAVAGLSIAANAAEAATESGAMAAAKGLAAAMEAAQMAADLAAQALTKMMGKDPGIPPSAKGALIFGHPNVLIGGFPMINIPNPAEMLLDKLSRRLEKGKGGSPPAAAEGTGNCPP